MVDLDALKSAVEDMDLPDYVAGYHKKAYNICDVTVIVNYNGLWNASSFIQDRAISTRAVQVYNRFHGDIEYLKIEAVRQRGAGRLKLETQLVGSGDKIILSQTMNKDVLSEVGIL